MHDLADQALELAMALTVIGIDPVEVATNASVTSARTVLRHYRATYFRRITTLPGWTG